MANCRLIKITGRSLCSNKVPGPQVLWPWRGQAEAVLQAHLDQLVAVRYRSTADGEETHPRSDNRCGGIPGYQNIPTPSLPQIPHLQSGTLSGCWRSGDRPGGPTIGVHG